jgi:hypothetical protein
VKDVERAGEPLDRAAAEPAPGSSPPVGLRRHDDEPPTYGDALERLLDPALPRRRHGRERDDLVPGARLREAAKHPEDVVADPGARQSERRDVDDYAHPR